MVIFFFFYSYGQILLSYTAEHQQFCVDQIDIKQLFVVEDTDAGAHRKPILSWFYRGDYPQPEKYNLSDDGKTESLNPEFVQWQKSDRLLHG